MSPYDPFQRRKQKSGWLSPTVQDASAIEAKYRTLPSTAGLSPVSPAGQTMQRAWWNPAGMTPDSANLAETQAPTNQWTAPVTAWNAPAAPAQAPAATVAPQVAKPAENTTQRWQNFGQTALDQRPAPQPYFTEGQRRRITTGRIGGYTAPSANERMSGATPIEDWRSIFGSNTRL